MDLLSSEHKVRNTKIIRTNFDVMHKIFQKNYPLNNLQLKTGYSLSKKNLKNLKILRSLSIFK